MPHCCISSLLRLVTTGFVVLVFVTLFLCPGSTFAASKKHKQRIRPSPPPLAPALLPEEDEPLIDQIAMESIDSPSHAAPQLSVAAPPPGVGYTGFKINPNCKCGKSPYPTPEGNPHPWTAAIFYRNRNSPTSEDQKKPTMLLFCTGSLINDRYVLTASRCVQGLNATDLQVWLSEKPMWSDQELQEQTHLKKSSVERIIIHPDFDPSILNHEVALLHLTDPVKLSRKRRASSNTGNISKRGRFFTTPVCLPKYDVMMDDDIEDDVKDSEGNDHQAKLQQKKKHNMKDHVKSLKGTVVSWDKKGRTSYSLVQTQVPLISGIRKCEEMTNNTAVINENMLCAGNMKEGAQDSCSMDTGSPLVIYENGNGKTRREHVRLSSEETKGHYSLIGISSWLYGCTNLANVNILYDVIFPNNTAKPQIPGVYARVEKYRDWITHNTLDAVWCA